MTPLIAESANASRHELRNERVGNPKVLSEAFAGAKMEMSAV